MDKFVVSVVCHLIVSAVGSCGGENFRENGMIFSDHENFNNRDVIVQLSTLLNDLHYILPNTSLDTIERAILHDHSHSESGNRIIGGTDTHIEEIPYQVAIYRKDDFHCGGSIITRRHILTAAHCIIGYPTEVFWVRVGSSTLRNGGQVHEIESTIIHEHFHNLDNDIAIMKIKKFFIYGPNVMPIKLPLPTDPEPLPGTMTVVSGWGPTEDKKSGPNYDQLMTAVMPLTSRQRCRQRIMPAKTAITEKQICTVSPRLVGTCFGDSGGPLVIRGKQFGVISWGSPCAIGDPDVFTNVLYYLPWIYKTLRQMEGIKEPPPIVTASLNFRPYPVVPPWQSWLPWQHWQSWQPWKTWHPWRSWQSWHPWRSWQSWQPWLQRQNWWLPRYLQPYPFYRYY